MNFTFSTDSRWNPTKLMADITQLITPSSSNDSSTSAPASLQDRNISTTSGNILYPNNMIFNALHMIENELFYREEPQIEAIVRGGLVTQSLAYLVGDLWDFYETRTKTDKDT